MKQFFFVLSVCLLFAGCQQEVKEQPYVPSEEMKPAYAAITEVIEEKEQSAGSVDYDLEETIRILNSLEVAQTQ